MFHVVIHTLDVVGERMAGPGIRAWHLSRELSKHVTTTLIARAETVTTDLRPTVAAGTPEARDLMRDADVLIGQPARGFRKRRRGQRIVYDMFDPTVLELRELYGSAPSIRQRIHLAAEWSRLCHALIEADLLMCAARRQRNLYERLQANDAQWIEVPFGVDLDETRACAKPQDDIVVWGGGVWEWLDPATAIDAVTRLNAEGLRCKLLFLGRSHPNQNVVDRRRDDRFEQLLVRGGANVSANADWVPFRERLAWLRSGKIAIMLHRSTAEAEYSIRTRLFDAIAAGIPVVASAGGFAAELVSREQLGIVVPPENVAAVAGAIRMLLTNDDFYANCVQNLENIRPRYAWDVVTRPLVGAIQQWQTH